MFRVLHIYLIPSHPFCILHIQKKKKKKKRYQELTFIYV